MADNSTEFTIDVKARADSAAAAATQVDRLNASLAAATAASASAADAVKAGQAAYNAVETASNRAALALEKVTLAAQAQAGKVKAALDVGDLGAAERAQAKFNALSQRQAELAGKAAAAKSALEQEAATLDRLKGAASQAAAEEKKIADAHAKATEAAKATAAASKAAAGSGKVNEIAEGLGKLGGPLGTTGQKAFGAAEGFKKLTAALGSAGPYVAIGVAVAAMAASFGALVIAAGAAAIQMTLFGIANAEAAQSQTMVLAGMVQSTAGGEALRKKITEIRAATFLPTEKITELAKGLAQGGLRGEALSNALESAAVNAAKVQFGPEYAKRLMTTSAQAELLKEHIADTFKVSDKALGPFAKALSSLVELFSTNTASGRAMQAVFQDITGEILGGATKAIPTLRTNFIAAEIVIMKGLIQLKHFTQEHGDSMLLAAKAAGLLAAVIIGGLAIAIGIVIVNLAIIGAALGAVIGLFAAGVVGVIALYTQLATLGAVAYDAIVGKVTTAVDTLRGMSLADIGTAMIDGLVLGITNSAAKVATALKGVVDGAVKGAKQALGIASPSKVLEGEVGEEMGAGAAGGIENKTGEVQDALATMVEPPEPGTVSAPATAGGGGDGAGVVNYFYITAGSDSDLLEKVKELVVQFGRGRVVVAGGT